MVKSSFYAKKRILVVGGSEGIGLSTAIQLTALNAHVVIASRNAEKLAKAHQAIEKSRVHPDQCLKTVSLDVTDKIQVDDQIQSILNQHGTPDFLINSAGVAIPGYVDDLPIDAFRHMMEVNYLGTLHTVKAVLPAMRKAGHGHIVNISSVAGYLGLFGYTGYCASKFAVVGFSEALRQEVKPYGIHVSVVCPPNTDTPGLQRENIGKPAEILAMEEKVHTLTPAAVARALIVQLPGHPFMIHPATDSRFVYSASRILPRGVMDYFLRRP